MSTVKVERRHREAAFAAVHPWEQPAPATRLRWLDDGWIGGWPQNEIAQNVAEAIAAAEQRAREECAREVDALADGVERDRDQEGAVRDHGRYSAFSGVAKRLRALAERMRKGGG